MTSTTSSHSEIVQIFKKIVRTLKEAKNNPAQYENLVSKLDASTKNALDVNIKKHNITVPTQDTNKVISEILSGMQTWLDTKSHIPMDLKQKFLELGSNNLELFIKAAYNKFNNKWIVKEFIDNAVKTGEEGRKYLADCDCSSTDQLWTKFVEPKIESLITQQDTNKLISEILSGMQTWLDTKSHIPLELKQKFLELGSNNLEEFIESAFNKFNNKWIVKEFIDNAFVPPREESNKYLADSGCDSAEQLWTKIENLRISEDSTDESEDDEISEASANKLGEKLTLNNGAEFGVKSILKCLSDKSFMDMILKEVPYNTREPLEKEIALQLVYNNIQEGRVDKSSTVNVINSLGNASTLLGWFVKYSDLTIEEIKVKEVELTGGASYLD